MNAVLSLFMESNDEVRSWAYNKAEEYRKKCQKTKLSADSIADILIRYKNASDDGEILTFKELCRGVFNRSTFSRMLRKLNLTAPLPGAEIVDKCTIDKLVQLDASGKSIADACSETGLRRWSVIKISKRRNLSFYRRLEEMVQKRCLQREFSDYLGCDKRGVRHYLYKCGLYDAWKK